MSLSSATGCGAKGPLEVVVARLAHVTEAGLAAARMHGGDKAGEAGELVRGIEAIDRIDLPVDDDGRDVAHPGEGLQERDGQGPCNPFPNALFKLSDLELQTV